MLPPIQLRQRKLSTPCNFAQNVHVKEVVKPAVISPPSTIFKVNIPKRKLTPAFPQQFLRKLSIGSTPKSPSEEPYSMRRASMTRCGSSTPDTGSRSNSRKNSINFKVGIAKSKRNEMFVNQLHSTIENVKNLIGLGKNFNENPELQKQIANDIISNLKTCTTTLNQTHVLLLDGDICMALFDLIVYCFSIASPKSTTEFVKDIRIESASLLDTITQSSMYVDGPITEYITPKLINHLIQLLPEVNQNEINTYTRFLSKTFTKFESSREIIQKELLSLFQIVIYDEGGSYDIPENYGILMEFSRRIFNTTPNKTTKIEFDFFKYCVLQLLKKNNISVFTKPYTSLMKSFLFRDEECCYETVTAIKRFWPYQNWKKETFFLEILSLTTQCLNDKGILDEDVMKRIIEILYIPIHSPKHQLINAVSEFCDDWFTNMISSYPNLKDQLMNEVQKYKTAAERWGKMKIDDKIY